MVDPATLTRELKQRAESLGFQLTGACPAVTPQGLAPLARWLAEGYAGEMSYFDARRHAYEHPRHVLDGARSLLMLGMSYLSDQPTQLRAGQGRVARYAASEVDYHDVIHAHLKTLCQFALELQPGVRARGVVDTAPLLEREFAQLAGLGWVGKNTMLLNRDQGSWFFLAALLLDCELEYDDPFAADHCGTCRACLDACPTEAFPAPYVLDATRCISYLTIELRGPIARELRGALGNWLFGCDVCQDVCPWNHKAARELQVPTSHPFSDALTRSLEQLFELSDAAFREQFRRTAFWRPRRRGLLRNAAIVLGTQAARSSVTALARGAEDQEPLVRGAAAWALGQIGNAAACAVLARRRELEQDPLVLREIADALRR